MPIRIECSDCGTALKVKEQAAGRKIRCPHCEAVIQVPAENEESDDADDEVESRSRPSSTTSRSRSSRRSQPGRSRASDDEELEELPPALKRKKKKSSQKSKSAAGGKVPFWAIVAGSSVAGVLVIAVIVFMAMKPSAQAANAQVAGGAPAQPPGKANVVQSQVDGPHAKFRMKFEMPLNWTSEGSIEDNRWPWATMKGQGQVIKLSSNRSLLGNAESMTTMGGADEKLKASHTMRGTKLQSENTDWVDGQLSVHQGKSGPVVWSDYEYKGVFGKGYGIRCTVFGPVMPCTLMLECGQAGRDKWRPTLLAIADSVHFVTIDKNGQEEREDFGIGLDDGMPNADEEEMEGAPQAADPKAGDPQAGDPGDEPEIN